ncbi:geranylgeranyl transferase type-2 subunit alpha isoform X2 [Thrips palmi]|uniref:Geranylgeranyl transferase type-2 subunit alpha n=1 Tax=Thrips palmi TaxID=161013 RepID=A0A6P9A119_THRPL|nr:geranylgeranyl transferase type-2 subunit alpha isoform X1 [Thrips palmi]XP_034251419.1 geranylgeranyl transferase type-2 subunit alpha isoform X2 [Thrips palmi]
MHGRLKVKTTKEQEEERRVKRAQKVKQYRLAYGRIVEKRQAGERDEEGLQISQQILEMIPDIHSLWNYRREIIEHLKESGSEDDLQRRLESERHLTETCLRANPKSYGAWHHRTWVMDSMPSPDWQREVALCTKFLNLDERNFHCWDYRRFVAARAALAPQQELSFTDDKIAVNFSNYSCWHYRSKLLPLVYPDPAGVRPVREDQHRHELELVQNAAFTDPNDQSAWFYQRWLLGRSQPAQAVTRALVSPGLCLVATARPAKARGLGLQLLLDSRPLDGRWRSADGQRCSSVWVFEPASPIPSPLPGDVAARFLDASGAEVDVALDVVADGSSAALNSVPAFGAPLSPALASVMMEELDACRQLLEFDPDSKWTLLTSVLLMQTIERQQFEAETVLTLDTLVELDYQRANYYKDLRSRLVLEYALERQRGDAVDLTRLSLTALYHAPLLALVKTLVLDDNHLRRPLPQLAALQCCETLSMDRNELVSLSGWGAMPNLRRLSLRGNALASVDSLAPLACCPRLRELDVRNNPVASVEALRSAVKAVLPGLGVLNGEPL